MKKLFNVLSIVVALLFISSKSYAAYSFNMELKNIVQINECTLRFDVYVKNTSATPAIDAISIENWEFQVKYNLAMTNGGSLNTAACDYVPGTSEFEVPNPLATVPGYPNTPIKGNTTAVPLANPTMFQSFGNAANVGDVLTYLGDNNPKRIGTFQIVNKTSMTGTVFSKNFASVLPNMQLNLTGCIISTCPSVLTDVSDLGNGSVMKYTRSATSFTTVTSETLTQPVLTDYSEGVNKPLYGYAYGGTGAYSLAANWNNAVGSTGSGYQTIPTANTDNISIGYFTVPKVVSALLPTTVLGACTVDAVKTVGDVTINAGSQLTLNSGITTTAANVYIKSDATSGTGTFVDMNLTGGLTLSGAANVQQYLPMGRNWYVSSPVSVSASSVFSATALNPLYYYTENTSAWTSIIDNLTTMGVMTGYVANMAVSGNVKFTGALNTGTKSINLTRNLSTLTKAGFNLVGNPYPSYVNWTNVIDPLNTGTVNMEPTMWYRTKNNATTPIFVFDTFNAAGTPGVGTNNNGFAPVTGYIPPMQAVWTRVIAGQASGSLNFTNAMRAHQDQSITSNRLKAPSVTNPMQSLLRLQVSNGTNSDEAIVYFNTKASDGYDTFDSGKMSNDNVEIPEIYTLAGTEKVVINGLKSVYPDQEIPLGFTTKKENTFTIKATEISDFDPTTQIILKDKLLNTEQELTGNSAYTFGSDVTDNATRFSIVFKSTGVVTGLNKTMNNSSADESMFIYKNQNGQITVNRKDAVGEGSITVSNAIGQMITSQSTTGTITVVDKTLIPGVYMVKVSLKGKNTTKQVIIN